MSCYQVCYVDSGIANSEEMEQLETIDSILVRF
jgi:zinc finger-containing ubiquitin peptidase 1